MNDKECVFCEIIKQNQPRKIVYEDHDFVAFEDINPSAAIHLLLVPRIHIENINLFKQNKVKLEKMRQIGNKLMIDRGATDFQLGFHLPPFTSVDHLHLHCIGKPFKNWFRWLKYPSFPSFCFWYRDLDRFLKVETSVQKI